MICHRCRIGFIGDLHVQKNLWGQGVATRALAYLRAQVPGYAWQTSRQRPNAKSFWLLVAERTDGNYVDTTPQHTCEHLAQFRRRGPPRYLLRGSEQGHGRQARYDFLRRHTPRIMRETGAASTDR